MCLFVRLRAYLTMVLLLLTVEVSQAEFMNLQTLPAPALQARFHLLGNCQPMLSALADPSRAGWLIVDVDCRVAKSPAAPPPVAVFMPGTHAHD